MSQVIIKLDAVETDSPLDKACEALHFIQDKLQAELKLAKAHILAGRTDIELGHHTIQRAGKLAEAINSFRETREFMKEANRIARFY